MNEKEIIGKLPPQNVEIESAILGACLLEKIGMQVASELIKPDDFYDSKNQLIFESMLNMMDSSNPIDILTVTTHLRKKGKLDEAGGPFYVTQLTSRVNSSSNIEAHCRIIQELSIKRKLINFASVVQNQAYDDTSDTFELIDYVEKEVLDITDVDSTDNTTTIFQSAKESIKQIQARMENDDSVTGVPSGFKDLDAITAGFQPGFIIIGARPGAGKSAISLTMARNAAVMHKKPVAFFSLEMPHTQLTTRLISAESNIESDKFKKGTISAEEFDKMNKRISSLIESNIIIDDTPALTIRQLKSKARRLVQQRGVEMIIVDYLQLMSGSGRKGQNREGEIAEISRGMKKISMELNIPVIALSQLNRALEHRGGDKRPTLADLRESGSLEQDADVVMFVYRPEQYNINEGYDKHGSPISTKNLMEVIIAKHRDGALDTVLLKFIGAKTKVVNWNDYIPADDLPKNMVPMSSVAHDDDWDKWLDE